MIDMPETIWVEAPEVFDAMGFWQEHKSADLVQYRRADLPPKVKPLEWVQHPAYQIWRCDTMIGGYKVFAERGVTWDYDSATSRDDKTSRIADTIEAAKAAAQADYEARILAALVQP